jgi:serine/threonine protein kinase
VARVTLDGANVIAEKSDPIDFPGFNHCTSPDALRLLKSALTSTSEAVTSMDPSFEASSVSNGLETWALGDLLGCGGFADAFADPDIDSRIIKVVAMIFNNTKNSKISKISKNSKLSNEHKTLQALAANAIENVPLVHGHLTSSEEGILLALKLSRRGIPLSEYLGAYVSVYSPDGISISIEFRRSLARLIGPVFVKVLQAAHSIGIVHQDIRGPNILIIPRKMESENIASLRKKFEETTALHNAIANLQLETCEFQLNDWGEAAEVKAVDARIQADLKSLMDIFCNLQFHFDVTTTTKTQARIAVVAYESVYDKDATKLSRYVKIKNYDGMARIFSKLR